MQIRNSLHLRDKIRESALDKIVSVSECWSWSRTVGNLLRNILKLQPRQYRTVQTTDSTDNRLSWTRLPLPRGWTLVY